jgi:hypothetical protein
VSVTHQEELIDAAKRKIGYLKEGEGSCSPSIPAIMDKSTPK